MLNYFGKIFAGGFFRTLGKIFAFLIVGIFIAWLTGFINIGIVNASSVGYYDIFGYKVDDTFTIPANGSKKGLLNIHLTGPNASNAGSYAYIDICTSGNEPTLWVTDNSAGAMSPSTKWYKVNMPCNISGVPSIVYRQIIYISNSKLSDTTEIEGVIQKTPHAYNISTIQLFSNTSTEVKMRILHFGVTEDVPIQDIWYDDNLTQLQVLKDILEVLRNSNNNDVVGAINNQTQKIEEQIKKQEETNNTIKDDSVDTGQANGFFDSFDNTDHGGISGVITAPLSALRKINQPCSAININLWDKDIELPCGDTLFWNRSDVSAFKGVWNVLIGGPIIYLLMVKLFKVIQSLKNPDDSRVEVAKL